MTQPFTAHELDDASNHRPVHPRSDTVSIRAPTIACHHGYTIRFVFTPCLVYSIYSPVPTSFIPDSIMLARAHSARTR
eukprot:2760193-Pleurochrysis_carterae.AAC.1